MKPLWMQAHQRQEGASRQGLFVPIGWTLLAGVVVFKRYQTTCRKSRLVLLTHTHVKDHHISYILVTYFFFLSSKTEVIDPLWSWRVGGVLQVWPSSAWYRSTHWGRWLGKGFQASGVWLGASGFVFFVFSLNVLKIFGLSGTTFWFGFSFFKGVSKRIQVFVFTAKASSIEAPVQINLDISHPSWFTPAGPGDPNTSLECPACCWFDGYKPPSS